MASSLISYSKYIEATEALGQPVPLSPWVAGREVFVRVMTAQIVALDAVAHFRLLENQ